MSCFVWCLHRHHHNQGYDDDFVETHGMSERSVLTGNVRELSQNFCGNSWNVRAFSFDWECQGIVTEFLYSNAVCICN